MRGLTIGLSAAAALFAAQASVHAVAAPKNASPPCFRARDIDNSVQATRSQLNIKTIGGRYFQINTKGTCFDSLLTDPYIIDTRGPDLICRPIDLDLSGGPRGFAMRCIVDSIVPLTKDQVRALPKKQQPG